MAAEKRKNRRKLDEDEGKPTKEEYAVAKFLRFNVPTRDGKLHSMEVHCFYATAAVDALLESKWSATKNPRDALFHNRHSCVSYLQRLLQKGLFHRADRVQRRRDKDKGDKSQKKKVKDTSEKEDAGTGDEVRERKTKKDKKTKKEKEEGEIVKTDPTEKEGEEKKEEKKEEGKKKKEKRLKLVMSDDQRFLDGDENIYVWIYDPVNAKTFIIGFLIVLGAIALCLFPLWPEEVRVGVYYLSLAAAAFVGFILSLVVVRLILFCIIWVLTMGKHHFWLLPNLTEDVGFLESFRPLYKHETKVKDSGAAKEKPTKSSKKSSKESCRGTGKKDKSSDKEDSGSEQEEFEMIDRGDVEGEEEEEDLENDEGQGELDEDADHREEEEEEYGGEEEEEEEEEQSGSVEGD